MRTIRACVAAVALAGWLQAAPAETLGVVAVAPSPGPGAELAELTARLRRAIAERREGVLDERALRARMAADPDPASLAELDRAYERARAAYVRGDYEGSLATLRAMIGGLEHLPDGDEKFARWTRAMLRLAKAESDLGRESAARAALERLLRAAPDVAADRSLYPKRFVDELENARASLDAEAKHVLIVRAPLADVQVRVEGRAVGAAPLRVALAAGRYSISGRRGDLTCSPVTVDLTATDRDVALDFTVAEALRPSLGPGLALTDREPGALVVAAGRDLGLDAVASVELEDHEGGASLVAALYDVARGARVRTARARVGAGEPSEGGVEALAELLVTGERASSAASLLAELVQPDAAARSAAPDAAERAVALGAPAMPSPSAAAATPPRPSAPALRGTTIGAGIAALGLVAFAAIETRSASGSYDRAAAMRASGGVDSRAALATYDRYVAEGDAATHRATIGWVGAGAAALAAGVVGYVNYRRTGEFGPFRF